MTERCRNPRHREWRYYGGRGVVVCERWLVFENFLADMEERPSVRHSIDRYPNQNGNYEPGNVRWATSQEQQRNRTNNRLFTHNGKTQCLYAWAEEIGLTPRTIYNRLGAGMPIAEVLGPSLRPRRHKS